MSAFAYAGSELEVFAQARNWKRYIRAMLGRYIRGAVLEVGAGIGTTMRALCERSQASWTALEPDASLAQYLESCRDDGRALDPEVIIGTLADLPPERSFDTILYVDVLEHIEDDRAELAAAVEHLNPGGSLVVLCPAHQFLYTAFDQAIGHFRRYNKKMFRALTPPGVTLDRLFYLDAAGLLLSLANRLLLKSASPSRAQIAVWDRIVVPCSRVVDPLIGRRLGKSIVGIWVKP